MTIKRYSNLALIPIGSHTQYSTAATAYTIPNPSDTRATIIIMQNTTTTDGASNVDIRYTVDGTTPTATKGFNLEDGDPEVRWDFGTNNPTIKVYLATGATLDYQWFTRG